MDSNTSPLQSPPTHLAPYWTADRALRACVTLWFTLAVIGQWLFLAYIIAFYGGSAVRGDLAAWNQNLSAAYVPGALWNNIAAAGHVLFAAIILLGGPLQLIPAVRQRYPIFHRWLGRIYMLTLVSTAIVGLFMLFARDIGGVAGKMGFVLQFIFIAIFAAQALRYAMARNFAAHRRWALRLFMVASAVWFFRVILMIWLIFSGGKGVDQETGKGIFLDIMAFGQYLPLLILELYFITQARAGSRGKYVLAAGLFVATILMAMGIVAAFIFMWWPNF